MYSREEAKKIRKNFWITFNKRCEIVPELMHKKKKWMLYDTGVKGVDLKFAMDNNIAMVMIELNAKSEDARLKAFELLDRYKVLIEDGFEDKLKWELCYLRDSGEEVSRIYVKEDGYHMHKQESWPDIYNFFIQNMLKLESNFIDIQDILKEELA